MSFRELFGGFRADRALILVMDSSLGKHHRNYAWTLISYFSKHQNWWLCHQRFKALYIIVPITFKAFCHPRENGLYFVLICITQNIQNELESRNAGLGHISIRLSDCWSVSWYFCLSASPIDLTVKLRFTHCSIPKLLMFSFKWDTKLVNLIVMPQCQYVHGNIPH